MSIIDIATKTKLREMGAADLVRALEDQDDELAIGLPFGERVRLAVDDAYTGFTDAKITGLIARAGLRYPSADLRSVDLVEDRGLDRSMLAELASCSFVAGHTNIVLQGFTGSGRSYLGSAIAKAACQHRYRAHLIRPPPRSPEVHQEICGLHPAGPRRVAGRTPSRVHQVGAPGVDGTPPRHRIDRVLHSVRQEGLAYPPGWSRPGRRHHGPHRAQRPLDQHRPDQHEATAGPHQPDHQLISPNPPADQWRSPTRPSLAP